MDEAEYKDTYRTVNQNRCIFEKAINSRRCQCSQSNRFNLADREGVACQSVEGLEWCTEFLHVTREKAAFSLGLKSATGPLPHANEIKVQVGGLLGLQNLHNSELAGAKTVTDVYANIRLALSRFGQINHFPYEEIIQSIARFEGRKKRTRD